MIEAVRARHAVLGIAMAGGVVAAFVACSSDDRPTDGDGNTAGGSADASFVHTDATTIGTDGASPSDAGSTGPIDAATPDAAVDAGPPCLGDTLGPDAAAPLALCAAVDAGICAGQCVFIAKNYRAGIAQAAAACISGQGSSCDDANACLSAVLLRACPTGGAPAFCAPLVKPCDPNADTDMERIGTPACLELANSLTTTARNQLASCMLDGIDAGTCPDKGVHCIVDDMP